MKRFCKWYYSLNEKKKDYVDSALGAFVLFVAWVIMCIIIFSNY